MLSLLGKLDIRRGWVMCSNICKCFECFIARNIVFFLGKIIYLNIERKKRGIPIELQCEIGLKFWQSSKWSSSTTAVTITSSIKRAASAQSPQEMHSEHASKEKKTELSSRVGPIESTSQAGKYREQQISIEYYDSYVSVLKMMFARLMMTILEWGDFSSEVKWTGGWNPHVWQIF